MMFPSQEFIKEHLPSCFSSFKNVRVIIDCFEIRTQSSRNFEEQGNIQRNIQRVLFGYCSFSLNMVYD